MRDKRDELSLSVTGGHREKVAICKLEKGLSPSSESVGTLILDSPSARTMREQSLLFEPISLWSFCYRV